MRADLRVRPFCLGRDRAGCAGGRMQPGGRGLPVQEKYAKFVFLHYFFTGILREDGGKQMYQKMEINFVNKLQM